MSCLCGDAPYQIVTNYSLRDDRFIRQNNGYPYCLWCRNIIQTYDSLKPLMLCTYCNTYIGHETCCPNDICRRIPCPYCNE